MKLQLNANRFVFFLALTAGIIGFSAFRQQDSTQQKTFRNQTKSDRTDTTTRGKRNRPENEFSLGQLDEHMKLLDEQIEKLEKQRSQIDFNRLQFELDEKLKKIDLDKIAQQMDDAMKQVEEAKLTAEANREIRETVRVDMEEAKKQLEKAKRELKEEQQKIKINTEDIKKQVETELEKAKVDMKKAREEMEQMKKFTDDLASDGLIDKNKAFQLQVKDGELYIEGKKQPQHIQDKYQSFLQKKNFTIKHDPNKKERI